MYAIRSDYEFGTSALVPVPELDESQAHVLTAPGKTEAGDGDNPLDRLLLVLEKMLFHLPDDLYAAFLGP